LVGETERNALRRLKGEALPKETVEINVDEVSRLLVEEDVLSVTIAETDDVADHRHDGSGSSVVQARLEPRRRVPEGLEKPLVKDGWKHLSQNLKVPERGGTLV